MSKLLTVFGATGTQGGSVARAVLNHPQLSKEYRIRAVTRDIAKPAAKLLEKEGMELVQADLNEKQSVLTAISGSYAVFGVTNFWEKVSAEMEIAQGKNIANASKEAGVKHLIWSSLPNVTKMTSGEVTDAKAYDSKAAVEEYIRELDIPATFYMPGLFMSSVKFTTRKSPDGYVIAWPLTPTTAIPLIEATSDTGRFVAAILSNPSQMFGKRVYGANGWTNPQEIVSTIQEVSGIEVSFKQIPDDVFKSLLPAGVATPRAAGMRALREWGFFGPDGYAEVAESLKILGEKPTSFKKYVERNLPWVG